MFNNHLDLMDVTSLNLYSIAMNVVCDLVVLNICRTVYDTPTPPPGRAISQYMTRTGTATMNWTMKISMIRKRKLERSN